MRANDEWIQPTAWRHSRGRETLAPAPFAAIRQVYERAAWDLEPLEVMRQDPAELSWDTRPDARRVHQITPLVIPDQE